MKSMAQECQEWWQEYARLNPAAEVVVGLQEWRDTLAFSEDEMRALVLSDGIRVLERPRELMEKMKDTIVQLKQEDLLNTIRSRLCGRHSLPETYRCAVGTSGCRMVRMTNSLM